MLYIIIPVYNRIKYTTRCIESILKQKISIDYKIVIVDSGSSDNTVGVIKERYCDIIIALGSSDMYWSAAINLGFEKIKQSVSPEDFICFMNDDVQLKNNCLQIIYNQTDDTTICTALSQDESGTVVASGSIVKSWIFARMFHPYRGLKANLIKKDQNIDIDLFTARCVMFSAKLYLMCGGINDKKFPHYGGDDYYSILAKRRGWSIKLLTSARLIVSDNEPHPKSKNSIKRIIFTNFNIKSSINIIKVLNWSLWAPPFYARPTHALMSIVKIIVVQIIRVLRV